jgi:hypothetical protein
MRRPLTVLRMHGKTCSIIIDLDSMGRDRDVSDGSLTDAESAAVDELMDKPPGRTNPHNLQLRTSRIIRRWPRLP